MNVTPQGGLDSCGTKVLFSTLIIFISDLDDDAAGMIITLVNSLELVGKTICWMAESESKNISMNQI